MEINSSVAVAMYSGQGSPAVPPKPHAASAHREEEDYSLDQDDTSVASDAVAQTQQPQAAGSSRNANADEDSKGEEKKSATEEQIKEAIDKINEKARNSEAIFGIHEETNRLTIKIVDKKTKDVIKELPPEKTLDLIAKAWELAGLLVDEKR